MNLCLRLGVWSELWAGGCVDNGQATLLRHDSDVAYEKFEISALVVQCILDS